MARLRRVQSQSQAVALDEQAGTRPDMAASLGSPRMSQMPPWKTSQRLDESQPAPALIRPCATNRWRSS